MKYLLTQCFRSLLFLTLLIAVLPHIAMAGNRTTLPICAAMSLKDAVTALQQIYEEQHPEINLEINFASSGALQKQIEQGAPAELFLSAGQKQMNALATQGLIVKESRCDLLGNTLVLVVAKEKQQQIKGFGDLQEYAASFAIGHPESVPAGRYGKQTLVSLYLWQLLEKRLVLAKNVRAVLAYVDSGNVDAGLVYRTDTLKLSSAVIAVEAPVNSHAPIIYPAALVAKGRHPAEAQKFLNFLQSDEAGKVFAKYRFKPLQNQPKMIN